MNPALYIVPTPVGNLDDITVRALKTLRAADIIACEDTRVTGQLLKLYGIVPQRLIGCREHNEMKQAELIIAEINAGKIVALVSDAGTPLVSDPGARVVREVIAAGLNVVPLPGATAFVPALAASGFDTAEFSFVGFPPQKKGRSTFIRRIAAQTAMCVMYESPHRLSDLLTELAALCEGERRICVAREITKVYEEFLRGTVAEVAAHFKIKEPRGEFVVILEGAAQKKE